MPGSTETVKDGRGAFLSNLDESRHWYRGSLEFGKRFAGLGPLYASDPSVQFCLQSARRQLGDFGVKDWYTKFKTHFPAGPWRDAAAAESWLTHAGPLPPKALALCRMTDTKPFLDGELDDACWKGHKPLTLSDAVADTAKAYPTEAWFASPCPLTDGALESSTTCRLLYARPPAGAAFEPVLRKSITKCH